MVWPQAIGSAESSQERVLEQLRREQVARRVLDGRSTAGSVTPCERSVRISRPMRARGLSSISLRSSSATVRPSPFRRAASAARRPARASGHARSGMWVRSMCSGVTEMRPSPIAREVGARGRRGSLAAEAHPVVVAAAQVGALLGVHVRRSRRPWRVTSTSLTASGGRSGKLMLSDHVLGPQPVEQLLARCRARKASAVSNMARPRRRGRRASPGTARSTACPAPCPGSRRRRCRKWSRPRPMLWPRLTPDSTRSGRFGIRSSTASCTQSVGVPDDRPVALGDLAHAQRLRQGECSRPAPDCSSSGAQIQTSSLRRRRCGASRRKPSAAIPSSLVSRIRTSRRCGSGRPYRAAAPGEWRCGPSLVLIVLHDRDQGAADREARAVQRVHETRALLSGLLLRASMRRAWKSPQFEQELISR